ncbi:hypothetical protein GGX14DRAFT_387755 [Mycena pura]|uniref:Uncharacterized protein n=1 Tax=Mycena pura TaxID=153505 RepID=A0AAD6YM60_9AGAR|nr:hypothetical protein GGX14DRAFT_387752 [Mycena pura]KAJ7223437.1 hypothetical protein GGX14DRAFT_387755 [Mycena pura]
MPTYKYDPAAVPSAMPLPETLEFHIVKNDQFAIPKMHNYQRAFLSKKVLVKYNLTSLKDEDHPAIYKECFDSKEFTHESVNPAAEALEEATLASQIASQITAKMVAAGDKPPNAHDQDAVRRTLRGYTIKGWEMAIARVVSNAVYYANTKAGTTNVKKIKKSNAKPSNGTSTSVPPTIPSTSTSQSTLTTGEATRILDLIDYTARKKFANDQREEILALAHTYDGSNAGANFNKAEKALWGQADPAYWEAKLQQQLDKISAAQCIDLIYLYYSTSDPRFRRMASLREGVVEALSKIQDTGRLPPFVATIQLGYLDHGKISFEVGEALPAGAKITGEFHETHADISEQYLGQLHEWAALPLSELALVKAKSVTSTTPPSFKITAADLEKMLPTAATAAITEFLVKSYEYAHATDNIPWALIREQPDEYFDSSALDLGFALDDPANLSLSQRFALATALGRMAGPGSPNFFILARNTGDGEDQQAEMERQQCEAADRLEADRVRKQQEADDAERLREAERVQKQQEADDAAEADRLRKQQEANEAAAESEQVREAERVRKQQEAEDAAEADRLRKQKEADDAVKVADELRKQQATGKEKAGKVSGKVSGKAAARGKAGTTSKRPLEPEEPAPPRRGTRTRYANQKYIEPTDPEKPAKRQKI